MTEKIAGNIFFSRGSDIFIPLLSWALITFPIWLSPFHPALVAYFIIAFDLYFFYKSVKTTYLATISYRQILVHMKIPYASRLKRLKTATSIQHFVIIPNFSEPLYKLESTIEALAKSDYPYKNIYLVLAFEEREREADVKSTYLSNKFKGYFRDIISVKHPLTEKEVAGKASNQTFAARTVARYVTSRNIPFQKTLITICDADSHLSKNYFSYLTYEFLKDKENRYHFYWAPVLLYNNFWQLPLFVRMQSTLSSIIRLAFLSEKNNLIQVSTYSTNLWLLDNVGYWDVDIIPEDWHIYFQAFFAFGTRVKTLPLFTIINSDAVYSGKYKKTLVNRYEQEKRWAWGVSDIGYALKKFFVTPQIDPISKLRKILFISETHLFWPSSFFLLTLSASIPPLINPIFKRTVMGFILPQLSGLILTITSLLLILYVYLDVKIRHQFNMKTKLRSFPLLIVQWFLLPLVSFLFSSLPALESHTRILLGKNLKYKVTEKV